MPKTIDVKFHRYPTGMVVATWRRPEDGEQSNLCLVWLGPGANVSCGLNFFEVGGSQFPMENDKYRYASTEKEFRAVARRFVNDGNEEENA